MRIIVSGGVCYGTDGVMEESSDGRLVNAEEIREEIRLVLRRVQDGKFLESSPTPTSPLIGALSIATEAIEDWLPDKWPEKALSGMIRAMHGDLTPEEAAELGYPLWKTLSRSPGSQPSTRGEIDASHARRTSE